MQLLAISLSFSVFILNIYPPAVLRIRIRTDSHLKKPPGSRSKYRSRNNDYTDTQFSNFGIEYLSEINKFRKTVFSCSVVAHIYIEKHKITLLKAAVNESHILDFTMFMDTFFSRSIALNLPSKWESYSLSNISAISGVKLSRALLAELILILDSCKISKIINIHSQQMRFENSRKIINRQFSPN